VYSLKPGRGPSIQKAIGGLVGGLFGVLWTVLAISLTANAPFPVVRIVFPLFGVIISLASFASAAYNFTNATSSQRFAEYDFVSHIDEPDPLNAKLVRPANRSKPAVEKFCAQCGGGLDDSFRYCPGCGTKV
jgi:hypothetical protein